MRLSEGWIIIFLHHVVIIPCSDFLSHPPSHPPSCQSWHNCKFTKRIFVEQSWFSSQLYCPIFYSISNSLALRTVFTPKSLSSRFLCSIRKDWSAIIDGTHWLASVLITLLGIRTSWINDRGYWALDVRTTSLWTGGEEREMIKRNTMRKVGILEKVRRKMEKGWKVRCK